MNERRCPALFIAAPASGQGKTTVTAALAYRERQRGRRVRVFKTGPDFLDPMILEAAAGSPVYQLDLWMGGEAHCRELLYDAAADADLILIEGVMGLFDGQPSSAELAALFGIPILLVIDGSAMAQTFGAIAFGLAEYRQDITVAGILANRVAGAGHYEMLQQSVRPPLAMLGWLPRAADFALPDRHLGLQQAREISDLEARLARASAALTLSETVFDDVCFQSPAIAPLPGSLAGTRVAIAHDSAFGFLYPANLNVLRRLGAEIVFFSPLADTALPDIDALYLPGGYPELHLDRLAANVSMKCAIRAHADAGKPIVAECGGMLYLLDSLTATDGQRAEMAGLIPGNATMQKNITGIAMQRLDLPQGELRGHTFHYSRLETSLEPLTCAHCPHGGKTGEALYRHGRITASYMHTYFPSNPSIVSEWFAR